MRRMTCLFPALLAVPGWLLIGSLFAQAPQAKKVFMPTVRIPAGKFLMGSPHGEVGRFDDEGPPHEVTIGREFDLGKFEVTLGQFRTFVRESGYRTEAEKHGGGSGYNFLTGDFDCGNPHFAWENPGWQQTNEHPVVNVSWNDAVAFCKWLSRKEGKTYRLPTEAEWEYACRGRTPTRFFSGQNEGDLEKVANIADATFRANYHLGTYAKPWKDGFSFTAPVGKFKPNGFGLCDMLGNVWEWCLDSKRQYRIEATKDPQGPGNVFVAVSRGGSFASGPTYCRCAYRRVCATSGQDFSLGFRVLRER